MTSVWLNSLARLVAATRGEAAEHQLEDERPIVEPDVQRLRTFRCQAWACVHVYSSVHALRLLCAYGVCVVLATVRLRLGLGLPVQGAWKAYAPLRTVKIPCM